MMKKQKTIIGILCGVLACALVLALTPPAPFGLLNNKLSSTNPVLNDTTTNLVLTSTMRNDEVPTRINNITNYFVNKKNIVNLDLEFEGGTGYSYAADYSGNMNGAVGYNSSVFGVPTQKPKWNVASGFDGSGAVSFDGTNYFEVPYKSVINPSVFTVSAWALDNGGNWNKWRTVVASRDQNASNNSSGYYVLAAGPGAHVNTWQCWIADGWPGAWTVLQGPAVVKNKWTQLVCSVNQNTGARFYVNGVLVDQSTYTQFVPNQQRPFRIGAGTTEGTAYNFWNGTIDKVQVYNRALSPQQVLSNYQGKDVIVSQELVFGDQWSECTIPNDGMTDGSMSCTNTVTIR